MKKLALASIKLYQKLPLPTHSSCRFYPRCSTYAYQAIQKYGILRGTILACHRLSRCHPGHPGGPDLLP